MKPDVLISHIRDQVSKEHDWRKDFYYKNVNNHKTNYIWARDKYIRQHIDRYLKTDANILKGLMK